MTRDIELIVIGGSAGAIEVLGRMLAAISTSFRPAVAIVIHLPPEGPNVLHQVFGKSGAPPMKLAEDKEPIATGTIYFARLTTTCSWSRPHVRAFAGCARALFTSRGGRFVRERRGGLWREAHGCHLVGRECRWRGRPRGLARAGGLTVVQAIESSEMIAMPAAALQAVPKAWI